MNMDHNTKSVALDENRRFVSASYIFQVNPNHQHLGSDCLQERVVHWAVKLAKPLTRILLGEDPSGARMPAATDLDTDTWDALDVLHIVSTPRASVSGVRRYRL